MDIWGKLGVLVVAVFIVATILTSAMSATVEDETSYVTYDVSTQLEGIARNFEPVGGETDAGFTVPLAFDAAPYTLSLTVQWTLTAAEANSNQHRQAHAQLQQDGVAFGAPVNGNCGGANGASAVSCSITLDAALSTGVTTTPAIIASNLEADDNEEANETAAATMPPAQPSLGGWTLAVTFDSLAVEQLEDVVGGSIPYTVSGTWQSNSNSVANLETVVVEPDTTPLVMTTAIAFGLAGLLLVAVIIAFLYNTFGRVEGWHRTSSKTSRLAQGQGQKPPRRRMR